MKAGKISIGIPELVILLGLTLVFISGFMPGGQKENAGISLLYQEVGTIGGVGFSYKHIDLGRGFTLSNGVAGTPLVSQPGPIEIAKGIFTTEEHTIEFSIPNLNEINTAKLEADIVDTNSYAPLTVYLNGKEVWKGHLKRGEKIEVSLPVSEIKSENRLRISCGSSGWRIWAPTVYVLENVKITETVSTGNKVTFKFSVQPEDLANFYSAKFYAPLEPKLPGEIAIILNNDKLIYRGVPNQRIFSVPFSSGIKENNTLEISLLSDGYYEFSEPQVVILTQKNATAGVSLPLKIPKDYLFSLKSGKLVGEIELQVSRSGETPLKVILSSETEKELYSGIPQPGKIVLRFTGDEVSSDNTILLRSGSIYEIDYVKVRLVTP